MTITLFKKAPIKEELRDEIILILKELLVAAEKGTLDALLFVYRENGEWFQNAIAMSALEMISRIEVMKHGWVKQVSREEESDEI